VWGALSTYRRGEVPRKKAFETCPLLKNESGKHFDKIRETMGVDLRKDLHGITVYGLDTDKTHGVAIVCDRSAFVIHYAHVHPGDCVSGTGADGVAVIFRELCEMRLEGGDGSDGRGFRHAPSVNDLYVEGVKGANH